MSLKTSSMETKGDVGAAQRVERVVALARLVLLWVAQPAFPSVGSPYQFTC